MLNNLRDAGYDVLALHHAAAILQHDMPGAIADLESVLIGLEIPIEEIVGGGGGEAPSTQRSRRRLTELGWIKSNVTVRKFVAFGEDERETQSLSHEIDHVKAFEDWVFALEIEWNNKDPFFDRDLESFKRLHAEGAISIGAIITRGQSLQQNLRQLLLDFANREGIDSLADLDPYNYAPTPRQRRMIEARAARDGFRQGWVDVFVSDKFGEATTHWRKLKDRVDRGVGNPCPLLLIGIPATVVKV
ncbi:MAG: restriction endonuclease [Alphaproteobacteria bacterium]|nr:restriction endonuclease [Alphaproteobacteria bacterium]